MNPGPRSGRWRCRWHHLRSQYLFVSFPKSGRTWLRQLLEASLRAGGLPPALPLDRCRGLVRRGEDRRIPRIWFAHPACRETSPEVTEALIRSWRRRRIVLAVRHPRGTILGYYHRLRLLQHDPEALSLQFPAFLRHPEIGLPRLIDFLNQWSAARVRFRDHLLVRHEDTIASPERSLEEILRFLALPLPQSAIAEAVRTTPDTTTMGFDDGTVTFSPADERYLAAQLTRLDPGLGYGDPPSTRESTPFPER